MIKNPVDNNNSSNQLIYRFDPRSKAIFSLLIIVNILFLNTSKYLTAITILSIIIASIFNFGKIRYLIKNVFKIYPMIFFTTFLLPFTNLPKVNEVIVFQIGKLIVYESGLEQFFIYNIKSISIFVFTFIFIQTTSFSKITIAMESLRIPNWIISIVYFMNEFINLLQVELNRIYVSYKARYLKMSYKQKIKIMSNMLIVYLTRIIKKNNNIYIAMVSRGFSGNIPTYSSLQWQNKDNLIVSIGIVVFLCNMVLGI